MGDNELLRHRLLWMQHDLGEVYRVLCAVQRAFGPKYEPELDRALMMLANLLLDYWSAT